MKCVKVVILNRGGIAIYLECHARTVTIEPVATGGIVVGRNLWPPGFNVATRLQCDHQASRWPPGFNVATRLQCDHQASMHVTTRLQCDNQASR